MAIPNRMMFKYHFRPVGHRHFSHGRLTELVKSALM